MNILLIWSFYNFMIFCAICGYAVKNRQQFLITELIRDIKKLKCYENDLF